MTIKRVKTVHYRKARMPDKVTETLYSLLTKATSQGTKGSNLENRIQTIDSSSFECRLMMRFKNVDEIFYGELAYFEKGKVPQQLIIASGNEQGICQPLKLDSMLQSMSKGERAEFPESSLYFVATNNHVAIVQSKSVSTKDLEYYLSWLLGGECCGVMQGVLALVDHPSTNARNIIAQEPVREIIIEDPLYVPQAQQDQDTTSSHIVTNSPKEVRFNLAQRSAEWFRDLLGQNNATLVDALGDPNLIVQVVVKYNRRTTEGGQRLLDEIAMSTRHMADDNVKIVLRNGSVLKGSDLKILGKVEANLRNGVIQHEDLWHEMAVWLTQDSKVFQ